MARHSQRRVSTLQAVTHLTRHPSTDAATPTVRAFIKEYDQRKKDGGRYRMAMVPLDVIALVGVLR